MNPQEFNERYARTLHTDPDTKERYLKLPIADLGDLGYLQRALLHGAVTLTQTEGNDQKETMDSIYWLCRMLLAFHPQDELDGLSEWLRPE